MKQKRGFLLFLAAVIAATSIFSFGGGQGISSVKAAKSGSEEISTGFIQPTFVEIDESDASDLQYESDHIYNNKKASSASDAYWAAFSGTYFYTQMTTAQKTLYNRFYDAALSYLQGTDDIPSTTYENTNETYYWVGAQYSDLSLSETQASYVIFLFNYNNPQFYFIDGTMYSYEYGYIYLNAYDNFATGSARSTATSTFYSTINSYLTQINAQSTDTAKIQKAHDLIATNTKYASGTYNQSCAGVFLDHEAVCAGYAEAFCLLANGAGVETLTVTSCNHEWNQVYVDNTWSVVDATWDDTDNTSNPVVYTYFMVTDAKHLSGNTTAATPESFYTSFNRPSCTATSTYEDAYYNGVNYKYVFNATYYANKYSDLYAAFGYNKSQLLAHFVTYGINEGRQAISTFDVTSYKYAYQDLRIAFYGQSNSAYVLHYINYGRSEGRTATGVTSVQNPVTSWGGVNYSNVYNYSEYQSANADIKAAFGNDDIATLQHLITYGMKEGRLAKSTFVVSGYKNRYSDLRAAFGSNLKSYYLHYITYGYNEGRDASATSTVSGAVTTYNGVDYSAVYDYNTYVNTYADIKAAFGTDDTATLQHFVTYGMNEGRTARANFNVYAYKNRYADLQNAFGNNLKSYYLHYITYGINEGRSAT